MSTLVNSIDVLIARYRELEAEAVQAEATAKAARQSALESRKDQGLILMDIKKEVGHGGWGEAMAKLGIKPTTATSWMRLAENWDWLQDHHFKSVGTADLTIAQCLEAIRERKMAIAASDGENPKERFEQLVADLAPWGDLSKVVPPTRLHRFQLDKPSGIVFFRSLNEVDAFYQTRCSAWNTIKLYEQRVAKVQAGRDAQDAVVVPISSGQSCKNCIHLTKINQSEVRCEANAKTFGIETDLGDGCRSYQTHNVVEFATPADVVPFAKQPEPASPGPVGSVMPGGAIATVPKAHPAGVLAKSSKNSDSEEDAQRDERYSPEIMWKPALQVCEPGLKQFDLDPTTNSHHNPAVPCKVGYTLLEDGLKHDWVCRYLWSNFPYSQMRVFIKKYLYHWGRGDFQHGFTLTKADCGTKWCQDLLETCTAVLLVSSRLPFGGPDGELSTSFFSSFLFYHGPGLGEFEERYEFQGQVMVRSRSQKLILPEPQKLLIPGAVGGNDATER